MSNQYVDQLNRKTKEFEDEIIERKRVEEALRESEKQYRGIFNAAMDSFLICDFNGNVVEANPQACATYGYSYEELMRLSGKDVVHPDYYHLFEQFLRDVQTTGEFHAESVDVRKDGTPFNIEVRGRMFDYHGEPHLLAVVRDITARKHAEGVLQRAHDELERRVEDRTAKLAKANEQLKQEID
jgi:PAS domain S-box-containing protein